MNSIVPRHKSDPHLNLFYSYESGSLDNLEVQTQLENNITRALILTMQNLEPTNQEGVLKDLLGMAVRNLKASGNEEALLKFDLPSVRQKDSLDYIQRSDKTKTLLTIGSRPTNFEKRDFASFSCSSNKFKGKK